MGESEGRRNRKKVPVVKRGRPHGGMRWHLTGLYRNSKRVPAGVIGKRLAAMGAAKLEK